MFTKLFTCLLALNCLTVHAQHADTAIHTPMQGSIAAGMVKLKLVQANLDSMQARQLQRLRDEAMVRDSINMVRSMDEFVRMQKEKDQELTRQLWIKGSMFSLMLAVTIVGAVRRRKQKAKG